MKLADVQAIDIHVHPKTQAMTLLQHKVLFGSDWPAIRVERWLEEFAAISAIARTFHTTRSLTR